MGNFLHGLGVKAFKYKWLVVSFWVIVLVALGTTAATFMKPTSENISIPGTPAQQALERFNELFPTAGAQSGRIVVATAAGKTIDDYQTQITNLANQAARADDVTSVVSPFQNPLAVSKDRTIGYIQVQLKAENGVVGKPTIANINTAVENARNNGLTVETGGDLTNRQPGEILGIGEIGGVILALIVLVITLGSLIAAGMPIIVAIVAVGISMAGLFSLSNVIDINSTTPALAVMLGLAVGIDYSLFIINRYRTYIKSGVKPIEASGKAIATAGNAVLFAAATVVIALAALAIVRIPFMTTMGLTAAATVALTALLAVSLIPALLGIAGLRIFSRRSRTALEQANSTVHGRTVWNRIGDGLLRHRLPALALSLLLIVLMAIPAASLRLGLPTDETAATDTSQRKAYDLLAKGFGPGFNGPLLVVVENIPPLTQAEATQAQQQLRALAEQQAGSPAQQSPSQLAAAQQQAAQAFNLYQLNRVAEKISGVEGVAQALPAAVTSDGRSGIIQVIPTTGPSEEATKDLVAYLRNDSNRAALTTDSKTTLAITGSTAVQIDINDKLSGALPIYLAVVVGLSLLLLMIAFRSILVPLKATLGFLLSVLAMFGSLVAVFQWGWLGLADAPGPIVSFIPIISLGILFGLAMDYEFFLVSSMHEAYTKHTNARLAIVEGYAIGSRVVVAAGLIMVSVFAGFITNHDSTIQSIGFALAIGILVDAFIVRLVIIPIIMSFLGNAAWWLPRWLEKRLPHLSIEGND